MREPGETRRNSAMAGPAAILAAVVIAATSCTSVAKVTNFDSEECGDSFQNQMAGILIDEGETPEAARAMAQATRESLRLRDLGPRPFMVSSPSGADYEFIVQKKPAACLLRLYGRRRGFTSITNNLTFIKTRPLPSCACSE